MQKNVFLNRFVVSCLFADEQMMDSPNGVGIEAVSYGSDFTCAASSANRMKVTKFYPNCVPNNGRVPDSEALREF